MVNSGEQLAIAGEVDRLRLAYELDAAKRSADDALDAQEKHPALLMARGRVLMLLHDPAAAYADFAAAGGQEPDDDRPASWKIAALSRQHKYEEAINQGCDAAQRFLTSVRVQVAIGRVHLDASNPSEALRKLRAAAGLAIAAAEQEMMANWQAACYAAMFQWKPAKNLLEEALISHPDSAELHYRLGRVQLDDYRIESAITSFKNAIERARASGAEHVRAREWLITALRAKGGDTELQLAQDKAEEVTEEFPGSPWLHVELAWVYCDQGKYQQATEEMAKAEELAMRSPWVLRSKIEICRYAYRIDDAQQAAERALGIARDDPEVLITVASFYSSQGKYDKAFDLAEEALRIDPQNAWALRRRIDFLRMGHRFGEAERAADAGKRLRPGDPDMHVAAAWLASAQDRHVDAAERIEEALAIDGNHRAALEARLYFLRWAYHLQKARTAAQDALERRGDDPDIAVAAGWVYSEAGVDTEAIRLAEKASKAVPRSPWIASCHVNFLRAAGRYDEAEGVALDALQLRRDDPYLLMTLARLDGNRGNYEKSLARVGQALQANPQHLEAMKWQISTLRGMLRFDEALVAARTAIQHRPQDLSLRVELGRVHDARLEFGAASEQYDRVLDQVPGNVAAVIARSAALRALRNYDEAQDEVARLQADLQWEGRNRDLRTAMGWIKIDAGLWDGARQEFQTALTSATNRRQRAGALHGLGWAEFAAGKAAGDEPKYSNAARRFCRAHELWENNLNYELGLAWSLAASEDENHWGRAMDLAHKVARTRPDPFAHACLGMLAFKQKKLDAAEYYLKRTVELDKYQGSYTDLGALYAFMARSGEAEAMLRMATEQDWHDAAAHVELGEVYLRAGEDRLQDAEREFRQALAAKPGMPHKVRADLGLAEALGRAGRYVESESVLRDALKTPGISSVNVGKFHAELAWTLLRRADGQQDEHLLNEACTEAKKAIGHDGENHDAVMAAGLAYYKMAVSTRLLLTRKSHLSQAAGYFSQYAQHSRDDKKAWPNYAEAQRYLDNIERDSRWWNSRTSLVGLLVGFVCLGLAIALWIMFFLGHVDNTALSVNTPVLLGLSMLSPILGTLTHLKMAGFEARVQPQPEPDLRGPAGDVLVSGRIPLPGGPAGEDFLGPGRFTVLGERIDLPYWGPFWPRVPTSAKSDCP